MSRIIIFIPTVLIGIFTGIIAYGFGGGFIVATIAFIAGFLLGIAWLKSFFLPEFKQESVGNFLLVSSFLLALASIIVTARLTVFILDEGKSQYSVYPFDDFFVHHSCLTAHYHAAQLSQAEHENIYLRTEYEEENGEPHFEGNFMMDVFLYPPPIVLFSRLGLMLSPDFQKWRMVWFGIQGICMLIAFLVLAKWTGSHAGFRIFLFVPLVWISLPMQLTLQIGNFHLMAIALSVLSMIAFQQGRNVPGGALLAFVTLSKIFPGVLLLLLLFQRRWKSAGWTILFMILIVLLSFTLIGWAPYHAFLSYHLPRLSSGSALETLFMHPDVIAANQSVYGLIQKLNLLGVPGMDMTTGIIVSWIFSIVVVGLVYVASRISANRLTEVMLWLALLQLASLRSPFVPDVYAEIMPICIVIILLAVNYKNPGVIALLSIGWLLLNGIVPTVPILPLQALLFITLFLQVVFTGFYFWIILVSRKKRWRID